jgi:hypothetical protein
MIMAQTDLVLQLDKLYLLRSYATYLQFLTTYNYINHKMYVTYQ